jgi:hypothetical protein
MTHKPSKAQRLILTLTLNLETETGGRPRQTQMVQASEALVNAIRTRLFEEGFLPNDVCVDTYTIAID